MLPVGNLLVGSASSGFLKCHNWFQLPHLPNIHFSTISTIIQFHALSPRLKKSHYIFPVLWNWKLSRLPRDCPVGISARETKARTNLWTEQVEIFHYYSPGVAPFNTRSYAGFLSRSILWGLFIDTRHILWMGKAVMGTLWLRPWSMCWGFWSWSFEKVRLFDDVFGNCLHQIFVLI